MGANRVEFFFDFGRPDEMPRRSVPALFVGDEPFFDRDRLDLVRDALARA